MEHFRVYLQQSSECIRQVAQCLSEYPRGGTFREKNLSFPENLNISSNLKLLLRHFKVRRDVQLLAK